AAPLHFTGCSERAPRSPLAFRGHAIIAVARIDAHGAAILLRAAEQAEDRPPAGGALDRHLLLSGLDRRPTGALGAALIVGYRRPTGAFGAALVVGLR